jgi:hypothetical protein
MANLRALIRGCPEPYVHSAAGHFVQEWGEEVAARALRALGASRAHGGANRRTMQGAPRQIQSLRSRSPPSRFAAQRARPHADHRGNPLNYTDGAGHHATDVVTGMGKRAKVPVKFDVMAWSMGYRWRRPADTASLTARLPRASSSSSGSAPLLTGGPSPWGLRRNIGSATCRIASARSPSTLPLPKENSVVNLLLVDKDADNPARLFLPRTDPNYIDLWVTSLFGAQTAGRGPAT